MLSSFGLAPVFTVEIALGLQRTNPLPVPSHRLCSESSNTTDTWLSGRVSGAVKSVWRPSRYKINPAVVPTQRLPELSRTRAFTAQSRGSALRSEERRVGKECRS